MILTGPARWDLVTAVIWVELVTVKLLAVVVPNLTDVVVKPGPLKFVPVMVTMVVPVVEPEGGVKVRIVGAGAMNL